MKLLLVCKALPFGYNDCILLTPSCIYYLWILLRCVIVLECYSVGHGRHCDQRFLRCWIKLTIYKSVTKNWENNVNRLLGISPYAYRLYRNFLAIPMWRFSLLSTVNILEFVQNIFWRIITEISVVKSLKS